LNTFSFDSGVRLGRWVERTSEEQRSALSGIHLDFVWSRRNELMLGTTTIDKQGIVELLRCLRGVKWVEVEVRYQEGRTKTDGGRDELVRGLSAAMGRLKGWVENERMGVECVVRAMGAGHLPSIE
jgi:hypothetical protein